MEDIAYVLAGPAQLGGQAVRSPRAQARVPRIIIIKGPNFFYKSIFLYIKNL